MVTNPRGSDENRECVQWMQSLLRRGVRVLVPEIADYEVRRELLRAERREGILRLDQLNHTIGYLPLTTAAMLMAAEFWAQTRRRGRPTADDRALDGDVILAAQAVLEADRGDSTVVATTNVGHLAQFVDARDWREIS